MLLLNYNNFSDMFLDINKKIIEEPEKYIEFIDGSQAYMPFTVIQCNTSECNLNLSKLCYTKSKIKILSKTYINKENLEKFKEHLRIAKGTSITYYFNNYKPQQGSTGNNGPCIISVVFTKKHRNDKYFSEANIYYRTTEVNRRFYADLVLFNLFIKQLPSDLIKIEVFRFIIPKIFIHTKNALFNLDVFDIDLSKNNPITNELNNNLKRFNEHDIYSYKCVSRIQRHLKGELKYKDVNMEELSL